MSFDPSNHNRPAGPGAADQPQPSAGNGHGAPEPALDGEVVEEEASIGAEPTGDEPGGPDLDDGSDPSATAPAAVEDPAAKAAEYLALAQRTQADFDNFRKRAARDARAASERGAVKLALALLPAVDNLERALEHAPEEADEHGFVAGVRHVHSDLIAALHKAGIEQYSPTGEPFDPTLHEAVAQTPIEGAAPGTVVEVYQRGYRAGETVVRPARVVVAG